MLDRYGRTIEYLRLSVTERCNLRCSYCRADEGCCPKASELSADEFTRIVSAFAHLGIKKVRLTGGEPLLRKDILTIVSNISQIEGICELSMTTNAQQLDSRASLLKQTGLDRVNISMDSLKPERFREMCGGDLNLVLKGIEECLAADLAPVKVNVVLVKGKNDDEIDEFIELTCDLPIDVRFIELMPLGELGEDKSLRMNNTRLIAERPYLIPLEPRYRGQPSQDYRVDGYKGRVGFISPHSRKFCDLCNRVRVMSDGNLRMCLGNNHEISLLEALEEKDDQVLINIIRDSIYNKPEGHHFGCDFVSNKNMRRIGG